MSHRAQRVALVGMLGLIAVLIALAWPSSPSRSTRPTSGPRSELGPGTASSSSTIASSESSEPPPFSPYDETRMSGRVIDASSRLGIPSAALGLESRFSEDPRFADRRWRALADADGNWQLVGVPPGVYALEVEATGYFPHHGELQRFDVVEDDEGFEISLQPAGLIEGRVLDPSGAPHPEASVTVYDLDQPYLDEPSAQTQSDELGRFVLEPAPVGPVLLIADAPAFAPGVLRLEPASTPVRRVQLSLQKGRRLLGFVRDREGPVEGASVGGGWTDVNDLHYTRQVFTRSDREGAFSLAVAPGQEFVSIRADGYQPTEWVVGYGVPEPIQILLTLAPQDRSVFIVLDPEGRPLENAHVLLWVDQHRSEGLTDGRGEVTLTGRRGQDVGVVVDHPLQGRISTRVDLGTEHIFSLPPARVLRGHVRDTVSGQPLHAFGVWLGQRGHRLQSPSGHFVVPGLSSSDRELRVTSKGYAPHYLMLDWGVARELEVEIELSPLGRIVLQRDETRAMKSIDVRWVRSDDPDVDGVHDFEAGASQLPIELESGSYDVSYGDQWTTRVVVEPGSPVELTVPPP